MPRIKALAASLLWRTGILGLAGLARRALRGPRLIVLCYHHVEDGDLPPRSATPAEFAAQAAWMAKRFAAVPLSEVAGYLAGKAPLSRDAVAVTFDDGYADNYSQVLPVLERHNIPAAFFIATDPLLRRAPYWYDVLWAGLKAWNRQASLSTAPALPAALSESLEAFRQSPSEPVRRKVIEAAKGLDREARVALVSALEKAQNPGAAIAPAPAMTPEEAEDCRRRGVELGGHTRAHPSLARIPEPECREEIAGCVRDLRERGFPVRYFAYPFGGPADVGGRGGAPYRVLSELRAGSGIELGLTTEERAVRPTDDPLLVPRKVIMPQTLPQVALKLELLAWRK